MREFMNLLEGDGEINRFAPNLHLPVKGQQTIVWCWVIGGKAQGPAHIHHGDWKGAADIAQRGVTKYGGEIMSPALGNLPEGNVGGMVIGGDYEAGNYLMARPVWLPKNDKRTPKMAARYLGIEAGQVYPYGISITTQGGALRYLIREIAPFSPNYKERDGSIWMGGHDLAIAKVEQLNREAGFDDIITMR